MHIVIFIKNLRVGGLQRVAVNLINEFTKWSDVSIILLNKDGRFLEKINSEAKIYELPYSSLKFNMLHGIHLFRRLQPDVILSFQTVYNLYVLIIATLGRIDAKIILTEHDRFSAKLKEWHSIYTKLVKIFYTYADLIITPSIGLEEDIKRTNIVDNSRIKTIYNPIVNLKDTTPNQNPIYKNLGSFDYIIAAGGRLTNNKNLELVIKSFDLSKSKQNGLLIIFGNGPQLSKLQSIVKNRSLHEHVCFVGHQQNVSGLLQMCDAYILTSKHEALPTTLIESLAVGTYVISVDCDYGPREIIENPNVGLLIREYDPIAIAEGIDSAIKMEVDEQLLIKSSERFSIKYRSLEYKEQINKLLSEN